MRTNLSIGLSAALLLIPTLALATTKCDDQAQPAIECPTGYSMMCNPVGGWHWSCGKEERGNSGISVEVNANANVNAGGGAVNANASATTSTGSTGSPQAGSGQAGTAKSSENKTEKGNATSSAKRVNKVDAITIKQNVRATSSDNHPAWGSQGGLPGFLRRIFGLGTSSSIGDVRGGINATSSAGAGATSTPKGLGFWARFLGFFGLGK